VLKPSLPDLLAGTADALARTVLGGLPPGPAHDQLEAAIALIRRVARALPKLTPYLQQDIQDLAVTLRNLGDRDLLPMDETLTATLAATDALPDAPLPDLDALTAVSLQLRKALADVAETATLSVDADEIVRALLARMEKREAELGVSPWGR
jgi:hypothetical protein